MQLDTQPFHVNTIELTCKKFLVRPEMVDKGKGKGIVIGDPRMSIISQKEIARKASDEKAKKSKGAGGQAQLMNQTNQPGPNIADGSAPTCGRSGAQTNGLANPAGQSTYDRRRQPLHEARKETQGQSAYSRLIKTNSTFDQLLSKNDSKKTVPRDRSTKKPRSPTKTKRPNKMAQKAMRQASPVHPMRPWYFLPIYSSSVYCPTQMWNGTTMNPWYIYSPFVYPGWGHLNSIHFDPLIK
jgi:hypothetical protein